MKAMIKILVGTDFDRIAPTLTAIFSCKAGTTVFDRRNHCCHLYFILWTIGYPENTVEPLISDATNAKGGRLREYLTTGFFSKYKPA